MIFNINAQIISYTISLQLKIIIKNSMSSEDKLTSYAPGYPGLPHGSPWDFSLTGCHLRKKSGDRCRNGWRPWLQFVHRSFTIDSMDCCWKICRKPMDFAAEFPMDVWIFPWDFPMDIETNPLIDSDEPRTTPKPWAFCLRNCKAKVCSSTLMYNNTIIWYYNMRLQ